MPTIPVHNQTTIEDPRSLVPVEWNTQERTRQELDRIKDSIKVHGLVGPLAARPSDRSIAGGHGRLDAILELLDEGYQLDGGGVPVVWKECDDAELMALNMALNNATGQPNFQKVAVVIRNIESLGRRDLLETGGTGFTIRQIEDLQILSLGTAERPQDITTPTAPTSGQPTPTDPDDYDDHLADSLAEPEGYEWTELTLSVTHEQKTAIDAAIALTGNTNQAEALAEVCRAYCELDEDG